MAAGGSSEAGSAGADAGATEAGTAGGIGEPWAAIAAEVELVDESVTASGRLELRHHLREQAISRTLHRFGNLIGVRGTDSID